MKEDERIELRLLNPRNVDQAMDVAIQVEDKLAAGSKRKPNYEGPSDKSFQPTLPIPQKF